MAEEDKAQEELERALHRVFHIGRPKLVIPILRAAIVWCEGAIKTLEGKS